MLNTYLLNTYRLKAYLFEDAYFESLFKNSELEMLHLLNYNVVNLYVSLCSKVYNLTII